jgi:hypothetical protein
LRDVAWASVSCPLNFTTLGVWPEGADGTDVNSCERSNNQKLLATADDFGKVKLFAYPALQPRVSHPFTFFVYIYEGVTGFSCINRWHVKISKASIRCIIFGVSQ